MRLVLDEADVRVCCTKLILKWYEHLETIGSSDRFHRVFVDAVRTHHWVYETWKILHRNISINNIMWYAKDDDKVSGMLCDWDLDADHSNGELRAAHGPHEPDTTSQAGETDQAAAQSQVLAKAAYRTGTGPFMAMDLLRPGLPPLHKYRHDLESFLYVYIYTATGYNPNKQSIEVVAQWQDESLINVGRRKRELFNDPKELKNILAQAHEEFQPLNAPGSFLFSLLSMFRAVEKGFDRVKDIEWSMEQFGDRSEDQLSKMEKIEKERDDGVTYSKFVDILKEKEDT
ncbi:hypothetical protein DAEQUDRAFT_764565 [Daedalea quercina L-15889]|uniref:Fungal-type protein kinase domain-containing protein n=1 Tax=Daedalea quercina L-15889 TaxID=1314783 RepID=A0A165RG34_9APHY|nr:hypothetical protein DAEQUDRAFT_764565 [Daedalea quercina L-15889]